jgi:uncharacterized protein (TIGR02266 family)
MSSHEMDEREALLAAQEEASVAREQALHEAVAEAAAERAEVLAFARDVRARLLRHVDSDTEELKRRLEQVERVDVPEIDARIVASRLLVLREEYLRTRESLLDRIDHELAACFDAADQAVEVIREARDYMLRSRHRRTHATPSTVPAPRPQQPTQDDRTVVMSAVSAPRPDAADRGAEPAPRISRAAGQVLHDIPGPAAVRQNRRRNLETRIDFQSDSNFFSGFSSNISDGGLFIATEIEVPIGTELDIRLTLPDGVVIACAAVVRWRRPAAPDLPAGVGVGFVDLGEKAREAIQRFMKRREPIFHET